MYIPLGTLGQSTVFLITNQKNSTIVQLANISRRLISITTYPAERPERQHIILQKDLSL